jgi:hypothetical protein
MSAPKRKRKPPAPKPAARPADPIGELLVAQGFVPNEFLLDLNKGLQAPTPPDWPWSLPSRLFQFPVEVTEPIDGVRRVGLLHPDLAEHPFVRQLEAAGVKVDPNGAPNPYGYTKVGLGRWWHTVDLIGAGLWRELIATRHFTTDGDLLHGVAHGLEYGALEVADARELLTILGIAEPADRQATLRLLSRPSACKQDNGAIHWPINDSFQDGVRPDPGGLAWARVFGIEAGWFVRPSRRYLQWSEAGRALYEAVHQGKTAAYVEGKNGQLGFVL